jgi:translation initiation factor 3 subunit J
LAAQAEQAKAAQENLTPTERRQLEKERQEAADLAHAADLFGAVGVGAGSGGTGRAKPIAITDPNDPTRKIDLGAMQIFKPSTKDDFTQLQDVLVPLLTANVKKPHYAMFLQEFVRQLAKDMSSENIRTVASKLTTLSNEKQKEEKAAEKGGKKKGGAAKKTALAAAGKEADRVDTKAYDNYDDL